MKPYKLAKRLTNASLAAGFGPPYCFALRLSVPFRCEGTVVRAVNENAPAQFAITFDNGPASATGVIAIIMPLPRKLDDWFPISL